MSKEREDVFNTPESGTYDPETKRHSGYNLKVNTETCEIVSTGVRKPPPEWIPEGWVNIGGNRWIPDWPDCKHRRVDVQVFRGAPPQFNILCIKYNELGEPIPIKTCQDCKVFTTVPANPKLPKGVTLDDLLTRPWEADLEAGKPTIHYEHPLFGFHSDDLDALEEALFQKEMETAPPLLNDPVHERNRRKIQLRWVPCIHRIEHAPGHQPDQQPTSPSGCSSCNKGIMCNNSAAEAFQSKVTRSICKACPVAESIEQANHRRNKS